MNPLLVYLGKSAFSLALFFLIYRLVLKNETFFAVNRLFLLLGMPLSLLIPAIRVSSPFLRQTVDVTGYSVETTYAGAVTRTEISDYLFYLYLAGAAVLAVLFLLRLLKLALLIKRYGITRIRGQRFVFTDNGVSDFTFFNVIFLDRSTLKKSELDQIIFHERIHIRQLHTIDVLVSELYSIVLWFNPFVWPYKRAIKETHEFLADTAVIAQGCDRAVYQTLIFERFVGVRIFSLANNFHQSEIKRRIIMMQKKQSAKWSRLRVLLMLPVLSILILAFARPRAVFDSNTAVTGPALSPNVFTAQDTNDDKKKDEIKKLEAMLKDLKVKYKKAESEEEKTKIKQKMQEVQKKLEYIFMENNPEKVTYTKTDVDKKFEAERRELKKQYKAAETDEERGDIKKKIEMLDKKYKQWQMEAQKKKQAKEEKK